MRIHLPLNPKDFAPQPAVGPSSGPLVQLGGELVLIELQGELGWEGDRDNGVIGVIGLDRPDKPTLHLGQHHLLHGKMANLPKPYAVIRRLIGGAAAAQGGRAMEAEPDEDEEDEDSESDDVDVPRRNTPSKGKEKRRGEENHEEDEEEPPLFAPNPDFFPSTPSAAARSRNHDADAASSSSPWYPASTPRDYSSELDASSPAREEDGPFGGGKRNRDDDDNDEEEEEGVMVAKKEKEREREEQRRKKRRVEKQKQKGGRERTRHYEVVGVVRKKVVFALRPEPIVTATVLPE